MLDFKGPHDSLIFYNSIPTGILILYSFIISPSIGLVQPGSIYVAAPSLRLPPPGVDIIGEYLPF